MESLWAQVRRIQQATSLLRSRFPNLSGDWLVLTVDRKLEVNVHRLTPSQLEYVAANCSAAERVPLSAGDYFRIDTKPGALCFFASPAAWDSYDQWCDGGGSAAPQSLKAVPDDAA